MQRNTLAALIAGLFSLPVQAQEIPLLDEIVVTATRLPTLVRHSLSDVSVLERTAIERMDHVALPVLLSTLPGIQVTTTGGRGDISTLSLRGGNAGHVAVFIDGLRISSATQGTTAIQAIPLEQIERIEVVRGPVSSLYGSDALSGVIQLFTAQGSGKPAPTAYLGAGSHGTTIASAGYGGQIGDTRFNLRAGMEQSDGFSSIKAAKGGLYDMYNPDNDAYANRNASASLSHRVSPDLELAARVFYSNNAKHYDATNCDAAGTTCTAYFDNRNQQELESAQASVQYRFNDIWDTSLRLGQSTDFSRNWLVDPSTGIVTIDEYRTRQNQITWQNNFKALGGQLTLTGEQRAIDVGSTKTFVVSEQTTDSLALGYQARYGRHSFQASGRHDRIMRLDEHDSGFIGYGYQFATAWTARASLGTAFHAPSFNDLYWPLDSVNFFQGNPNLQPEQARNREIGLVYTAPGIHAGVTAYHNKVSNLIDYVPGVAPSWIGTMGNVGAATLKGVSLDYAARTGPWSWKLAYDVLSAKDDATGNTLQRRAPRNGSVEIRREFGGFDLGAHIQATSHRYNNKANTQRLPGYAVVDLDANYPINRSWKLEAKIGNLFDQDYTQVRSTMSPYNDYAVPGRTGFVGLRYAPK
ncbi:MAG: hypothetical protein B7Y41_03080 [Hydrogenophilales bacterium 28-61-23]|nr:MAG: hypothetical protein B7Y41_03080 [Hydrogenophilales bacterium 28-61-23]